MDYNSLMEEARAMQEEKTKKLAKMREQQKRNEIEKQKRSEVEQLRKVIEKQKQTKVNRIKQTSKQLHTTNRDKQSELQIKHNRTTTLEENNKTKKTENSKKTNDPVVTTTPNTNSLITNIKPVNKTTTITITTTQPSRIHTNEVENNKVSTKPTTKKPPYNYTELMKMATKNNQRKFGQTKNQSENKFNNIHIPKANKSKTEEKTVKPESNEKRKITEDSSTTIQQTQTQTKKQKTKDTSIDNKKIKIEPKEEPKPRRQIEPSDFFKKTFDKSPLTKKPTFSVTKLKTKSTASRPAEQTSEEDDDFIVSDDDNPGFNVSAFIQNMFRYNKNKYADEDARTADESMVSNYTQQQYEERRSARIGKLEDLEDIRREEEMMEKLAAKKKKNKGLKRLQ